MSFFGSKKDTPKSGGAPPANGGRSSSGGIPLSQSTSNDSLASFYSTSTTSASPASASSSGSRGHVRSESNESPDLSHMSANDSTFVPHNASSFYSTHSQRSAADVLNELDERYMTEEFDPVKELFATLGTNEDFYKEDQLQTRLHEFELVQTTIDKKLSSQVLKNYPSFVSGLELITDISSELASSRNLCTNTRDELKKIDETLTHAILHSLQKQRTMTRCKVVILRLHEVYTLLRKEKEINILLKHDEFIQSVRIYKECLRSLGSSGLNAFTCLDALRARFLRTGECISTEVKSRFLSLLKHFSHDAFRNLIHAMINLGDYKFLTDFLKKFSLVAIEENAADAILPYTHKEYLQSLLSMQRSLDMAKAMMNEGNDAATNMNGSAAASASSPSPSSSSAPSSSPALMSLSPSPEVHVSETSSLTSAQLASLPRKPFLDLCSHLDLNQFSLSFLTLASGMCENMYAIQSMIVILGEVIMEERKKGEVAAAKKKQPNLSPTSSPTSSPNASASDSPTSASEAESICQSLEEALQYLSTNRSTLWSHMSSLFSLFFSHSHLSVTHISVEDFVRVLKNGEDFVEIGEKFGKTGSTPTTTPTSSSSSTLTLSSSPITLRSVLHAKSSDYIRNFLYDSLTTLSNSFHVDTFRPLLVENDFTPKEHVKEFKKLHAWMERRKEEQGENEMNGTGGQKEESKENAESREHQQHVASIFDAFLSGANPFTRAIMDQKNEYEIRARDARITAERKAVAEAARIAAITRPALRAPGSGPVRASALNLSVGRPAINFALPVTGGMTGGVPTVVPRSQAHAAQQNAAANAAALTLTRGASNTPGPASSSSGDSSTRPFLLSCTLTFTKIFGKYLSLLRSFPEHGLEVLNGLQDVVELFIYTYIINFGVGYQGFFVVQSTQQQTQQSVHAELLPINSSPNYLVEMYPTLRALMASVKNRVELGSFGGGADSPKTTTNLNAPWAKEWKQNDVVAAANALVVAQNAWNGASSSPSSSSANSSVSHLHTPNLTTTSSIISPSSGAPHTLASVAIAQAAAAAASASTEQKKKEKEKDSFFGKLKEKMSTNSEKEKAAKAEAAAAAAAASQSAAQSSHQTPAASLNAVSVAANQLASISASHPPPALVQLSTKVQHDLESNDTLLGLVHRVNAIESLDFIFLLLEQYIHVLQQLLPSSSSTSTAATKRLNQFHSYMSSISHELREYLYSSCAPILLPKEAFLSKLNQCRWDIKDLQTKYNTYVDTILNTLRVNEMSIQSSGGLSPPLLKKLWSAVLAYLTDQLVDAYSRAKKCTTEGRGLMTLDLSALRSGLEKLTNLKPLPHWDYVLGWVNAYYLQEAEFLTWVTAHPEYTMSQVISIAQCGCGANKPSKERLVLIGNVTNAHAASVDQARKTRDEAMRKKKSSILIQAQPPAQPEASPTPSQPISRAASRPSSRPPSPKPTAATETNVAAGEKASNGNGATNGAATNGKHSRNASASIPEDGVLP